MGETLIDPFTPTFPMPLIVAEVAFCDVHVSVEVPPAVIVEGLALKVGQEGAPGGVDCTTTVVTHVALPPGPVTVSVYVVVTFGETLIDPLSGTLPIPRLIDAEVALFEVQVSVDDPPTVIVEGLALKTGQEGTPGGGVRTMTVV